MNSTVISIRWVARILSVPILLFGTYLVYWYVVSLAGTKSEPPCWPVNATEWVIMVAHVVALAGLALAWKYELAGGIIALGAGLTHVIPAISQKWILYPGIIILINAALFLIYAWHLRKSCREKPMG